MELIKIDLLAISFSLHRIYHVKTIYFYSTRKHTKKNILLDLALFDAANIAMLVLIIFINSNHFQVSAALNDAMNFFLLAITPKLKTN